MSAQSELEAAAVTIRSVVDGFVAIFTGGPTQTVDNGSTLLPSIAKLITDAQARLDAAVAAIEATPTGGSTALPIVPSDTVTLDPLPVGGLYFPDGGLVALQFGNGAVVSQLFAPNTFFPNIPSKVLATGTDAGITIIGYFP